MISKDFAHQLESISPEKSSEKSTLIRDHFLSKTADFASPLEQYFQMQASRVGEFHLFILLQVQINCKLATAFRPPEEVSFQEEMFVEWYQRRSSVKDNFVQKRVQVMHSSTLSDLLSNLVVSEIYPRQKFQTLDLLQRKICKEDILSGAL